MSIASAQAGSGSLPNAYHIVSTGGGVILSNNTDIILQPNVELTCSGDGIGSVADNDYRSITNAIVLNPTMTSGGPYTVKLAANTSSLSGCNLIAGPGPQEGGGYPNPYSPMLWYPNCDPGSALGTCNDLAGNTFLRSATNEYSAFNPNETAKYNIADGTCVVPGPPVKQCGPASASVGIHLTTSEHLTVRNVTVLGFGTCVGGTAKGRLLLDGVQCDCWMAMKVASHEMPTIRDCANGHLLAGEIANTSYR